MGKSLSFESAKVYDREKETNKVLINLNATKDQCWRVWTSFGVGRVIIQSFMPLEVIEF